MICRARDALKLGKILRRQTCAEHSSNAAAAPRP